MKKPNEMKFRLVVASVVALLVMGVCFNIIVSGGDRSLGGTQYWTRTQIKRVARAMEDQQRKTGVLPRSPGQIRNPDNTPYADDGIIFDGWRRPLRFAVRGDSYVITSLGRDGKPGGVGLDCDLSNRDLHPRAATLPVSQIVFNPSLQGMVVAMLVSGALTFLLTFKSVKLPHGSWGNWVALGVQLAVTLAATVFVAMIITMLHYPSGH